MTPSISTSISIYLSMPPNHPFVHPISSNYPGPLLIVADTALIDGAGSPEQIEGGVKQIRAQIEESTSDQDREKLQERVPGRRPRGGDQGRRGMGDMM
jgi:hypothetical protein